MSFAVSPSVRLFRLTIWRPRGFIGGRVVLRMFVLAAALLTVAVGASLAEAATPTFAAKQDFSTGPNPRSVAAGDLNGDGKSDLAVANVGSDNVSVLLNTTARAAATSNFSAKKDFAVGTDPVSIILGDLNSDGKLDLVVANNSSNNVSVLLNMTAPGAVTPNFAIKQDFVAGDGPVSVAVGDLNGDGKLDLVVVGNLGSTVSVFINNTARGAANVSFAARKDFAVGDGPRSVVVADFNLDGKPDLAVVNFNSSTVSVLLNTTNAGADAASFAAIQDFPTGLRPVSVAVGDLNGDTKPDLAVANSNSNTVSVLLNTTLPGTETPSFADKKDFATNFNPSSVMVGDLNGDVEPELAIANSNSNNISVFVNTTARGVGTPSFDNKQDFATDGRPESLTSSDLNNDGKTDLAVVNFDSDTVSVLLNLPTIATASGLTLPRGSVASSVQIATVADSGGNGNLAVNVVSDNPANGVTISNIVNSDGKITADILTSCGAVNATFTLQANDGGSTVTGTLNIAVTPDNGPTVSYQNQSVNFNGSLTINPTTGISANGIVFSVESSGSFTGNIRVDAGTGEVSITNAAPAGTHEITIRASDSCGATTVASFTLTVARDDQISLLTLSQANYNVNESSGLVTITINRTGDLSNVVSVNYGTQEPGSSDVCSALNTGLASSRCDFGFTSGKFVFAANETQKTFVVPITQDSYNEGPETFIVSLSKPNGIGATLGNPSSATVTIADGLNPLPPNANDDTETFVRQQYRDFLNREADPAGLAFWTAEINGCTPKPTCTNVKRVNSSGAFFLSIEFQTTGNLVRSFYVAALDRPFTNNMPAFEEFERDTQALQRGVIVDPNNNAWETVLNNNRNAFMRDFVTRAEFIGLYPTTDTPTQYVDKLYLHAGITPTAAERNSAIAEFGNATTAADEGARGRVLLEVTQNATFQHRESNRSFVQMQYFGYLRRNPNDPPDGNFAGFDFWLGKLNQFNGDFVNAQMVEAFISSEEYRARFGP